MATLLPAPPCDGADSALAPGGGAAAASTSVSALMGLFGVLATSSVGLGVGGGAVCESACVR